MPRTIWFTLQVANSLHKTKHVLLAHLCLSLHVCCGYWNFLYKLFTAGNCFMNRCTSDENSKYFVLSSSLRTSSFFLPSFSNWLISSNSQQPVINPRWNWNSLWKVKIVATAVRRGDVTFSAKCLSATWNAHVCGWNKVLFVFLVSLRRTFGVKSGLSEARPVWKWCRRDPRQRPCENYPVLYRRIKDTLPWAKSSCLCCSGELHTRTHRQAQASRS